MTPKAFQMKKEGRKRKVPHWEILSLAETGGETTKEVLE